MSLLFYGLYCVVQNYRAGYLPMNGPMLDITLGSALELGSNRAKSLSIKEIA